ncbi:MAG: TonB family protein [candidate division Zixibacteria bacterium]|nr:TonB family protein [candidate division Zixibacteria bacterium]MDH3938739.1 TonB family protein [candidate division Zixibacteria bacterium]MDH4033313.1 TonB family protein [candidate division Zixibacteria bacterium]
MSVYSLWSPYGAFELKSKYQRNFLYGTGLTTGMVLLVLLVAWITSMKGEVDTDMAAAVVIKTVADLGPPPSIARKPPQVKVEAPQAIAPKVGIPKPVADDEVLDDDVQLATRDELAEIVAPDIATAAGEGGIEIDISEDDYLPAPDEFIPLEIQPEMIYQEVPDYPRLAKQAGITGIVWVNAALDETGKVIDVVIAKSSGTVALDEAAAKASWNCKFKPGIQNGRPVRCRVVYKVDFVLD